MASKAYNDWVALVKRNGGRVVVPPIGAGGVNSSTGKSIVPTVLSAAYPSSVWVPKVNLKNPATGVSVWPLPNEYSSNGQTGYYHAPNALIEEASHFGAATPQDIKSGAEQLMNQWGIPDWLRSPGAFIGKLGNSVVLIAIVAVVAYVATRKKR